MADDNYQKELEEGLHATESEHSESLDDEAVIDLNEISNEDIRSTGSFIEELEDDEEIEALVSQYADQDEFESNTIEPQSVQEDILTNLAVDESDTAVSAETIELEDEDYEQMNIASELQQEVEEADEHSEVVDIPEVLSLEGEESYDESESDMDMSLSNENDYDEYQEHEDEIVLEEEDDDFEEFEDEEPFEEYEEEEQYDYDDENPDASEHGLDTDFEIPSNHKPRDRGERVGLKGFSLPFGLSPKMALLYTGAAIAMYFVWPKQEQTNSQTPTDLIAEYEKELESLPTESTDYGYDEDVQLGGSHTSAISNIEQHLDTETQTNPSNTTFDEKRWQNTRASSVDRMRMNSERLDDAIDKSNQLSDNRYNAILERQATSESAIGEIADVLTGLKASIDENRNHLAVIRKNQKELTVAGANSRNANAYVGSRGSRPVNTPYGSILNRQYATTNSALVSRANRVGEGFDRSEVVEPEVKTTNPLSGSDTYLTMKDHPIYSAVLVTPSKAIVLDNSCRRIKVVVGRKLGKETVKLFHGGSVYTDRYRIAGANNSNPCLEG